MKFDVIVMDPPWGGWNDKLTMNGVKRGADSNYKTMTIEQLKTVPIQEITADDSVLALWALGSQLQDAMDLVRIYGFRQTQTWVWVKTKQNPLEDVTDSMRKYWKNLKNMHQALPVVDEIVNTIVTMASSVDMNTILSFNMGRLFRQTHEICLLGVKGKVYSKLENKSQRSVCFDTPKKHSTKTEILQDRLDIMFPKGVKLEMFGRRERSGWTVVGNECPSSLGEDIFDSIKRLG